MDKNKVCSASANHSSDTVERILQEKFRQMSVNLFGVGSIQRFSQLPEQDRPEALLPGAHSVIAVALPVLPSSHDWGMCETIEKPLGRAAYQGMIDHVGERLDQCLYEVGKLLLDFGYQSLWCPTFPKIKRFTDEKILPPHIQYGVFSQVIAGYYCGIGSIGMNHMLLTKAYGPRIRVNSIITEAVLPESPLAENLCTHCGRCIRYCPVHAFGKAERTAPGIPTVARYNKQACWKSRVIEHSNHQCDWGGLCVKVCPIGEAAQPRSGVMPNLQESYVLRKERIDEK